MPGMPKLPSMEALTMQSFESPVAANARLMRQIAVLESRVQGLEQALNMALRNLAARQNAMEGLFLAIGTLSLEQREAAIQEFTNRLVAVGAAKPADRPSRPARKRKP